MNEKQSNLYVNFCILAMFSSALLTFSTLQNNKSAGKSRLREQHVQSIFKITTTQQIKPNFADLVAKVLSSFSFFQIR